MQSVPKNLIERRAIALGAHNVDFDMRDRKCSQADLQPYTAKDDEICSWYGSNPPNTTTIEKARFETILDLDRFDCTNERRFPFDGYFLLAGGQNLTDPSNAPAIEALIPCLHQPATISFE
uniref:Peptidase S1 domain-containing protein n=1 Tax=Ascaris lumbricoides TaxID=6252 RepID=A0A0M3HH41_ASCLU